MLGDTASGDRLYQPIVQNWQGLVQARHVSPEAVSGYLYQEGSEGVDSYGLSKLGKPRIAKNAPWNGGVTWAKDKNNNPWISISCQGLGASVWYPCKDHQSDEADSAEIHITAPSELVSVANGKLRKKIINKRI